LQRNKLFLPVFAVTAAGGALLAVLGAPYGQFMALTFAGTELGLRVALEGFPSGGEGLLLADCAFAFGYAFLLSAAARDLAPGSGSPAAGRLLAWAIWIGAAADVAENLMLIQVLKGGSPAAAPWLRAAAVLKFALFVAACGWVGGASWRAGRKIWSAWALAAGTGAIAAFLPSLLG